MSEIELDPAELRMIAEDASAIVEKIQEGFSIKSMDLYLGCEPGNLTLRIFTPNENQQPRVTLIVAET